MKSILIVEDERSLAELIKIRLEEKGYTVKPLFNGLDALEYLNANTPDLLILDLMLPGMDGYQILKRLTGKKMRNPQYNPPPTIVLTARNETTYKEMVQEMGTVEYITKPFDMEILLNKVVQMLTK